MVKVTRNVSPSEESQFPNHPRVSSASKCEWGGVYGANRGCVYVVLCEAVVHLKVVKLGELASSIGGQLLP